jgi:hypothetical protein
VFPSDHHCFPARPAERGTQRFQERLRLLHGRIVADILDHVQRPAMAGADGLRDWQRRREIVPPPDEGRGNGNARQVGGRDCRYPELLHEAVLNGLQARCTGAIQVVRFDPLPPLT